MLFYFENSVKNTEFHTLFIDLEMLKPFYFYQPLLARVACTEPFDFAQDKLSRSIPLKHAYTNPQHIGDRVSYVPKIGCTKYRIGLNYLSLSLRTIILGGISGI
jgi:hypothetical protein